MSADSAAIAAMLDQCERAGHPRTVADPDALARIARALSAPAQPERRAA